MNELQWLRGKETWDSIITFYVTDKSRQSQEKKKQREVGGSQRRNDERIAEKKGEKEKT